VRELFCLRENISIGVTEKSDLLGNISEIDGTPEFYNKMLPIGVILSEGGWPVC